jgi:NAD(P)H-flavin reductase
MTNIIQTTGVISKISNISPTAREYTIKPNIPLTFTAGAFVNVFVDYKGEVIRRAFSMSSTDTEAGSFTLSIRLSLGGRLTPLMWEEDFLGREVKLMGPLGLNTADKMNSEKVFLFGFGIGAGVVKSLADNLTRSSNVTSLTIVSGNRNSTELLHKDYFDELTKNNQKVSVKYVVSDRNQNDYPVGYIQDHVSEYDFNNADVYMCGQTVACVALEQVIKETDSKNCNFFIEDFH